MLSILQRLKVGFRAVVHGSRPYLIRTTTTLPNFRAIGPSEDRIALNLLKWINRNMYLLGLISTDRQHCFQASFDEKGVRVNCYLTSTDGSGRWLNPPKFGLFSYFQKEWFGAMGARYAPFMTPIREGDEPILVESDPLFSFYYPFDSEWEKELSLEDISFRTVNHHSSRTEAA